jgi:hypothetical protein
MRATINQSDKDVTEMKSATQSTRGLTLVDIFPKASTSIHLFRARKVHWYLESPSDATLARDIG